MVLEKTFTRGHYIKNVKRSQIKQIPEEDEGRHIPQVRSVKKRDSLLLKGQSDEMNATFNLDRSTIYKKAYDTLSGNSGSLSSSPRQKHSVSPPPSAEQSKIPLRTPILDHVLRKSFEQSEAEENPAEHLPHIKMALDWSSSKPSGRPPASALTNQFKLLTSSGASFANCPVTPPRTRDIRLAGPQVAKLEMQEANRLLTQRPGERSNILLREQTALKSGQDAASGASKPSILQQLSHQVAPGSVQRDRLSHHLDHNEFMDFSQFLPKRGSKVLVSDHQSLSSQRKPNKRLAHIKNIR